MSAFATWPAIVNGFPILFDDTSVYIGSSRQLAHWPVFYNIIPFLARVPGTLWAVVLAQSLVAVYILAKALALLAPNARAAHVLTLVAAILILSQLPWLVSYLMPDVFGGLGLVSLVVVVFAWDRMRPIDQTLFLATVLFSGLVATANTLVFISIGAALFLVTRAAGRAHTPRSLLLLIAVLLLGLPVLANVARGGPAASAVGSSARLFSKLVDNNLAVPFLDRRCRHEHFHACDDLDLIRAHVGDEGFLWEGPANAHQKRAWLDVDGDYGRLARRIIADHPFSMAKIMSRDSAMLAARVTLLSDDMHELSPNPRLQIPRRVIRAYPKDGEVAVARQQRGSLIQIFPERFYEISAACSLVLSLLCLWSFSRERDRLRFSFTLWVILGVALAIIVHGSLSSQTARYNVKFSWLLWVPPALWFLRWHTARLLRAGERIAPVRERVGSGQSRPMARMSAMGRKRTLG